MKALYLVVKMASAGGRGVRMQVLLMFAPPWPISPELSVNNIFHVGPEFHSSSSLFLFFFEIKSTHTKG